MNFDLTDEQKDIVKAAREFAGKELPDLAQECDREEKAPKHFWQKACALAF
jgi:alkylation response protein AidB-like acyl-CoA dehydrogenase